jgi:hypothetical protein
MVKTSRQRTRPQRRTVDRIKSAHKTEQKIIGTRSKSKRYSRKKTEDRHSALGFRVEGTGLTDVFGSQRGKQQNRSGREPAAKKIR